MRWAVLLVLSGCLFPSLDDLSSADGAAPDVATNDVVVSDAPPVDAASDVPVEASGPFCPQQNTVLCSDFDETGDAGFEGAWDYVFAPGTTTFAESTAFFTSAPRSLLVMTTSADNTAIARKDVGFTNGITLELDVRIVALGNNASIASFVTSAGALTLQPRATQTNVLEATNLADGGTTYGSKSSSTPIPTGTWVHIAYDWDRTAHTITVKMDGNLLITTTPTNSAWNGLTTFTVHIGVGASASETVYYDDVTIRSR